MNRCSQRASVRSIPVSREDCHQVREPRGGERHLDRVVLVGADEGVGQLGAVAVHHLPLEDALRR